MLPVVAQGVEPADEPPVVFVGEATALPLDGVGDLDTFAEFAQVPVMGIVNLVDGARDERALHRCVEPGPDAG